MRTTVTLDPDVERLLRDATRRSGQSFKAVLNRAIREGLAPQAHARVRAAFRIKARPMGLRPGIDPAGLKRLLDDMAIDDFIEPKRQRR